MVTCDTEGVRTYLSFRAFVMYVRMCVHVRKSVHTCINRCVHVCVCRCVYVYMYSMCVCASVVA